VTVSRQPRDYAAEYQRRIERAQKLGLTPSQARGHPKPGEVPASRVERDISFIGRRGTVTVAATSRERRRASDFDNDVKRLVYGRITPREFDRRWAGKTIAGIDLPTANEVLALSHRHLATFDDFYPHGRVA
jgi:hypothetical protein